MSSFKRKNLVGGLVELSRSQAPSHTEWKTVQFGKLVFQKDYGKKSFFFRLYTIGSNTRSNDFVWQHEMYIPFEYMKINTLFHYFPSQDCYIGFNFSDNDQADKFFNIVETVSKARAELYKNELKSSQKSFFKNHLQDDSGFFSGFLKAKKSLEKIRFSNAKVNKPAISYSKDKKISQNDIIQSDKKLDNLDRDMKKLEINSSVPEPPPLIISSLDAINSDKKLGYLDRDIKKLEINSSIPEPPPLIISSLLEHVDKIKKPIETKSVLVDPQQALMDSIRNFKGFKPKDTSQNSTLSKENSQCSNLSKDNSQTSILSKEIKPDFQTELKNVISERRKFLKLSSDESESESNSSLSTF